MSEKIKRRKEWKDARGSMHLTPKEWIKNLVPEGVDVTSFMESVFIATWGSPLKQKEEIKQEIFRKEGELSKIQGQLIDLKRKLEDTEREEERLVQIKKEVDLKDKYARWVVFRQLLKGDMLGKAEAVKRAFGVETMGKLGTWSILLRKKYAPHEHDYNDPDDMMWYEKFVKELVDRFFEISPWIKYVGRGSREKKEFQSYLDSLSGSLRMCGEGHLYDALENGCPECNDSKKGIYLVLSDGEISGMSSTNIVNTEYQRLQDEQNKKDLEKFMLDIQKEREEREMRVLTDGGKRK
ncbi:MAG: hypothetical protein M1556_01200 [Candidatus Thermoplasmatota archaeon]|jgi:hypothetical protein|nr:hypothetical protein [Candidatus Thermoplasmatota archaeon]MCL6002251.1 hypothetical protein [Candidatus Thermoplasmatota archaeon]